MSGASAAVALSRIIQNRPDFRAVYTEIELLVTQAFLQGKPERPIDVTAATNLLRYADVLSHSTEADHRELAYTSVALLREYDELVGLPGALAERVQAISEAILVQLGNFPGLRTLQKGAESKYSLPLSRGTLRIAKEVLHRTNRGDAIFTDAQYEIAESMRDEDYFSFSGPTSLGKSFIIKDALYNILRSDSLDNHCVVVLVPTKALIGQTAADLRDLLVEVPEAHVATFPSLPRLLREKYRRTVFVLTPERLIRYLAQPVREIDYLVVDEAQKIIAKNDARSSLYYHAIVEATRRFATKLIFASPSIQNPELFLELFGKATNGAVSVRERTVAQQRYFVDLVGREQYVFSGLNQEAKRLEYAPSEHDAVDLVISRSGSNKAIIYVNGANKASEFALRLAEKLDPTTDSEVTNLVKHIQEYVHKQYFLGDTLRHGVAFHHGKMPQEVRERVEEVFADPDSPIRYIVCTSTLLEGVNLPAKNIFVLTDKHGNSNFTKINFENLAGRAGRLTYDFSGNVICVRDESGPWSGSTRQLMTRGEPHIADSFLVQPPNRRKKEYTDIAHILRGEELPGKASADAKRSAQQYATILMLHQIDQQQTPLRSYFLEKVNDGRDLLKKASASIDVPTDVLRRSPNILPDHQNRVWRYLRSEERERLLPPDAELDRVETFHTILRRLCELYNWRSTESLGKDPLISPNTSDVGADRRLMYWAILMRGWVRGDPLNRVIAESIAYYERRGTISYRDYSKTPSLVEEIFDPSSARHVNLVIEWTLRDIEGGLRFRIIAYLQNFYDMSVLALGDLESGTNVATLVEYGTTDSRAIELQEVGFSRGVASELLSDHGICLQFSTAGELEGIDEVKLLASEDLGPEARNEVTNILLKTNVLDR